MRASRVIIASVLGVAAAAWVPACGSEQSDGDGESHFLATCGAGCTGSLSCVCGVCTRPCAEDGQCTSLGRNAECLVDAAACGSSPRAACGVPCKDSGACSEYPGLTCRSGLCAAPGSEASPEGGTGGTQGIPDASVDVIDRPDRFVPPPSPDWDATPAPPPSPGVDATPPQPGYDAGPCCFDGTLEWYAEASDRHQVSTCEAYEHFVPGNECNATLPACGQPGITVRDLSNAVAAGDVRDAFDSPPERFGRDERVTTLTYYGRTLHVGTPCDGAPSCLEIPAGVAQLVSTLKQIEFQQRGRGTCRPRAGCFWPRDTGPCDAAFQRFAYDPKTGSCSPFTYGGCGGNDNRFETRMECQTACADFDPCRRAESFSDDPLEPGSPEYDKWMAGGLTMFFFDSAPAACGCACSIEGTDSSECTLDEQRQPRTANCTGQ